MSKRKGMDAEREIVHLFWSVPNWVAARIAGSGSMRYPAPDIIAGSDDAKLLIEAKITKSDHVYIPHEEVEALQTFAAKFDGEALIAYKLGGQEWRFVDPFRLERTEKNVVINKKSPGITFRELIESAKDL